jgi:hypothetical protein
MPHARAQRSGSRRPILSTSSIITRARSSRLARAVQVGALVTLLFGSAGHAWASEPAGTGAVASHEVQALVDAMRADLGVPQVVGVDVVEANPLKASVEPVRDVAGTYRLSIEQGFLEQLTQDELKAVIAHELGHVWIYTHHPYLQTEQLANQIAMKVVSRETLDKVYGKVWADATAAGSLPRFTETRVAAAEPDAPGPQN